MGSSATLLALSQLACTSGKIELEDDLDGDGIGEGDCNDSDLTINPSADEIWYDGIDQNCDGKNDYDQDGDGYVSADYALTLDDIIDGLPGGDCDDTNAAVSPIAREIEFDGLDNDCDPTTLDEPSTSVEAWVDADGDGYGEAGSTSTMVTEGTPGYAENDEDCDDEDPLAYPGAEELCDGVDNDCDTEIDEDATTWYEDFDEDDFGNPDETVLACEQPEGYVANADDCDDLDPTVSSLTWYEDNDFDGYGDDATAVSACGNPGGYVAVGGDCDDTDPLRNPGATELCTDTVDLNCDDSVGYENADGDAYAACEECDDSDPTIYPDAEELCDSVDNNCDGTIDENDAVDARTWYADDDADGYGNPASTTTACSRPAGHVANASDCDDTNPLVNEITLFEDADGDGFGDDATETTSTALGSCAPAGYVEVGGDCDDSDPLVNEITLFEDVDGDGFGDDATETTSTALGSCAPAGYVEVGGDCDDTDPNANPGETEVCDPSNTDEDCDGAADNNDLPATGLTTYYPDVDGDGYGDDSSSGDDLCDATTTYEVSNNTDCDDGNASRYAGSTVTDSTIDGLPNDCDLAYEGPFATTVSGLRYTGATLLGNGNGTLASGNFNGDGYDDLLVGEPYSDTAGTDAGTAHAVLGGASPSSALVSAVVDHTSTGEAAGDNYGLVVANAGDVDGDGYDDAFIGAPFANSTSLYGAGYLYYGSASFSGTVSASSANAKIGGITANEYMGWAAIGADIDGDGDDELFTSAIGYSSNTGAILLFDGSGTRYAGSYDRTDADEVMTGNAGDVAGASMSTGDVSGDGTPDLVASATEYGATNTGRVHVVQGTDITSGTLDSISWITIDGDTASDTLGHKVLVVPDMDGDGQDELLVCASYKDISASNDGACYLFLTNGANSATFSAAAGGALTTLDADYELTGPATDENLFGNSAAFADVDADGVAELAISAYSDDTYGTDAGLLGLWNGATLLGLTPGTFAIDTDQAGLTRWYGATGDEAGTALTFADHDGDGDYDLFVASPKAASSAGAIDMQQNSY